MSKWQQKVIPLSVKTPPHPPAKSYGRHGVETTVDVVFVTTVKPEIQISIPSPGVHTDGYPVVVGFGEAWSQELFEMSIVVTPGDKFTS